MSGNSQKLKLLYLVQMFEEETDPEKGMTMPQIIEYLYEHDISAERKSIYRDISILREFGMDIRTYQRSPVEYALAERDFELSELMLLVDAVQSSRFLSEGKSKALVKSIRLMASNNQRRLLNKQVNVHGRPQNQAQSDFVNVDCIQSAIAQKKKIAFKYYKYNVRLEKIERTAGKISVTTPVSLIYSDDNYYLVGYSDAHDDFTHYRVDRMGAIQILEDEATKNDRIMNFDPNELARHAFSMYGGEKIRATFKVKEKVMNVIADKFGTSIPVYPQNDGTALVEASVLMSPALYGWLAEMGADVEVMQPARLRQGYADYIERILALYK